MLRNAIVLLIFFYHSLLYSQIDVDQKLKKPLLDLPAISFSEAGFRADSIKNLIQQIGQTHPNDYRGLVVIKDGKLAIEAYFNTYWRDNIHDIRSAGKSITALLLGFAIEEGWVKGIDQPITDFFPKNRFSTINSDYQEIQLRHLLQMSSGLDADSDDINSPGNAIQWVAKDRWIDDLLSLPIAFTPGERWVYADVNAILIGKIIEETSGQSLADFAHERLFSPLGIREFYWYKNAEGTTGAAGNLYLSALDLAKIGQLMLNQGQWEGHQLVSKEWIATIAKKELAISDYNPFAEDYGFFWYKTKRKYQNGMVDCMFASGNGGNVLMIIPELNMVISSLSSAYGKGYGHTRTHNIINRIIMASMEE